MKKIAAIVLCAGFPVASLFAQDLSGFWKGSFSMQGCFPNNNIEIQLTLRDGELSGDSYHFQDINNYVKKKISGTFDASGKRLRLKEGMVTTYHIPHRCVICIKSFDLVYSRDGNVETLRGEWGGNVLNSVVDCGVGAIVLTRTRESAFKDVPEIKVDTGTIRLDFYDNAEIDGDSISVRVNNQLVLSHQRLTARPLTTYLQVNKQAAFHEVEMIAENQGSIPPNTAVLIITAGEKKHRLNMSATESKVAKVRFVYEAAADSVTTRETAALRREEQ